MGILRKSTPLAVVPKPDNIACRKFHDVTSVDEVVPLYDSKGNKVDEHIVKVVARKPLDDVSFEHRGESCDLFSIENQINAGVNLQEFRGSFITPDLSESSYLGDLAISQIKSRLEAEKQNVDLKTE